MNESATPSHSRLRPFLFAGVGFLLGVAVTIDGIWLSIHYFVSWVAESDISVSENSEGRLFDAGSLDKARAFAQEVLATAERHKDSQLAV